MRAPTQYRGHLGLLLDQEFGALLSAPVFALALAGVVTVLRERRWRLALLTAGPFALAWFYLGAVSLAGIAVSGISQWYAGFSPAARFVTAALPLLAVGSAVALDRLRGRLAWGVVAGLYAVTLGHSVVVSVWPAWRFQHAVGRARALVELFRRTGLDAGRLLPSYIVPGDAWVAPGLAILTAIALAGWFAARRVGTAPPPGVWIAGTAGAGLIVLTVPVVLWLSPQGSHPAILGDGRGGQSFYGVITVDTGEGPSPRERLVWAAQRPAVLELAPRLRAGTYRITVNAGAQGGPEGLSLGIRLGDTVEARAPMDGAPDPVWRERDYVAVVAWPGGRLPIRVELAGVSRASPARLAYVHTIEITRVASASHQPPG